MTTARDRCGVPGRRAVQRQSTVGGPPWQLPVALIATAVVAQVAGLLVLARAAPDLARGTAYGPAQLAAAHLLGLAMLTVTMVAALLQLVPVLVRQPVGGTRTMAPAGAALVAGAWLLPAGLWTGGPGAIAVGGTLVVAALAAVLVALAVALWRARAAGTLGIPGAGVVVSACWLAVLLAVGGAMAAHRVHPFLEVDRLRLAGGHAVIALVGWVGGTILAVALKLGPMFALSHGYPTRPGTVALILWNAAVAPLAVGVALDVPALIVVGAALLLGGCGAAGTFVLGVARHRRRRIEAPLVHLAVGVACAAGACAIPMAAWAAGADVRRAAIPAALLALVGLGTGITSGHLFKVVPMLVWTGRYANLAGTPGVPRLSDLIPPWAPAVEQVLFIVGLAALVAGVAAGVPALAVSGAGGLVAAASVVAGATAACVARHGRAPASPHNAIVQSPEGGTA